MTIRYDKKLLTQLVNELVYEVEALRMSVVTSSVHLTADNQERCESFLDEAHVRGSKIMTKIEEFYHNSEFENMRRGNS